MDVALSYCQQANAHFQADRRWIRYSAILDSLTEKREAKDFSSKSNEQ
jgi:hypothetical protein